jgi:hypothetical protein
MSRLATTYDLPLLKNKCGLLIFPGKLPQAPSGRQSAAPQLTALRLRARVNSVPPREPTPAFSNRERTPPPKPPLTAILSLTRLLFIPFLFGFFLGNERANSHDGRLQKLDRIFLKEFCESVVFALEQPSGARTGSIRLANRSARYSLALQVVHAFPVYLLFLKDCHQR